MGIRGSNTIFGYPPGEADNSITLQCPISKNIFIAVPQTVPAVPFGITYIFPIQAEEDGIGV
jgi:hypothetical protein